MLDRPLAAAIPFSYQVATAIGLTYFARTRRYERFRTSHVVLMLILPFLPGFVALTIVSGLLDGWLVERATPMPELVRLSFFVLNVLEVAGVTFLVLLYFLRQRGLTLQQLDQANQALRAEQATSEGLLRNILPDAVAARLKGGVRMIADSYEAVTVLFIDVVDFAPLAARHTAAEVVDLLDRVFSALDALAEQHGLEKIKTVGDAVNVASRMESHGLPDHIQVSLSTFELLERDYELRFRGSPS